MAMPKMETVPAASRRSRVLVIDDEPFVGLAVRRVLEDQHEVTNERTVEAALARIAHESFDVILCDVTMPGADGIDLYQQLRGAHPELVDRVVFLTGGTFTDRATGFIAGVPNKTIHKPFEIDELRAVVAAVATRT
jgi:DNA-binding response OmpR family regulator